MSKHPPKFTTWLSLLPLFLITTLYAQEQVTEDQPTTEIGQADNESGIPAHVQEELSPKAELGARKLDDISEEAREVLKKRLIKEQRRVSPPVPARQKREIFDQITAVSGMSMRDMFNFMTSKKKVAEGISFDDVIESMDIKANEINFKKVGVNAFWKDVGAISGVPTTRVEIMNYCDATVGRRMLDYSPEFVIFIPCRIAIYEDATGDIWLMTMDWDVTWLTNAWHPDSKLSKQLIDDAVQIRDAMEEIMQAGATGEW